ncbi:putative histone H2AXa-like [Capsicum annuum]|nr:putative histone H2AXa-like [Capsicum annuum]
MAFALPFFNLAPDLTVSKLCLGLTFRFIRIFILQVPEKFCLFIALELFITLSGTMTFGEQNTSAESFKLLDKAFNSGVNFFDSAEMYPVPQRAETHGRSEEYFGRWIRERKVPRDNVVLATKEVQIVGNNVSEIRPNSFGPLLVYVDSTIIVLLPICEPLSLYVDIQKIVHNDVPKLMGAVATIVDLPGVRALLDLVPCVADFVEAIPMLENCSWMAWTIFSSRRCSIVANLESIRVSKVERSSWNLELISSSIVLGSDTKSLRSLAKDRVSGPSGQMSWIRNGPESLDAQNITEAIDNSLLRIKTDYIDLYQIHWPDRYVPMFGETDYDPLRHYTPVSFEEQLDALERAVDAGKIRYIGLSNETPYGIMKFQQVAKSKAGNLQIVSVQNAYNLLCRNFDLAMAECCHNERISLLAYSPLAMGILSGKYFAEDGGPSNARLNLFKGKKGHSSAVNNFSHGCDTVQASEEGGESYIDIADRYDIHPVSLAIAFIMRHPLVASVVFGASKVWQLEEVLDACKVNLSHEIITEINTVHLRFPSPCP